MSNDFTVCPSVINKINKMNIVDDDKKIVIRCVGGYSKSRSIAEKVAKLSYRWDQYQHSYPDWKHSVKLMGDKKFHYYPDDGNISTTIVANIALAPFSALDYLLQDSPETKLRNLINENNSAL